MTKPLRACADADLLPMLVFVHLDDGVEPLFQRIAICGEADHREHNPAAFVVGTIASNLEKFRRIACVDVVAACASRVTGYDREVLTADSER